MLIYIVETSDRRYWYLKEFLNGSYECEYSNTLPKNNIEIISSMGTANKSDPNSFKIIDINQTSYCPLAKKVRTELRKKQINNVKVCFSNEVPTSNEILVSPMYIVGSASLVISKYVIELLINS